MTLNYFQNWNNYCWARKALGLLTLTGLEQRVRYYSRPRRGVNIFYPVASPKVIQPGFQTSDGA